MEIFFVLVWLGFSVGVGVLAANRGRSGVGWGLLALLTSPLLAAIILLLLRDLAREAEIQEREAMHHREQLAVATRSQAPARAPTPATSTPPSLMLVADELEKLASLRDKSVLTEEEFTAQKARILSGLALPKPSVPVPSGPAIPVQKTPQYQLKSARDYIVALKAVGCQVMEHSPGEWEVLKPTGVTVNAHSLEELASIYERL